MRLRSIPQALIVAAAAACAAGPGTPGSAPRTSSRTVLTEDELRTAQATNLFDAVQRLRPEFTRGRGMSIQNPLQQRRPGVFHNGIYLGPVEMLRSFSPQEVVAVRRLSAADVTLRYGSRYGGIEGIEVVTFAGTRTARR